MTKKQEDKMNYRAMTLTAVAILTLSGFGVLGGLDEITTPQWVSSDDIDGTYHYESMPDEPMYLPETDPRADVPEALLDQLSHNNNTNETMSSVNVKLHK